MSTGSPVSPSPGSLGGEPNPNLEGSQNSQNPVSNAAFTENNLNQQKNLENQENPQKNQENEPKNTKNNSDINPPSSTNSPGQNKTWSEHIAKSGKSSAKDREQLSFTRNSVPQYILDRYSNESALVASAGTLFQPVATIESNQKLLTTNFVLAAFEEEKKAQMDQLNEGSFSGDYSNLDDLSEKEREYIALRDYILNTSESKSNIFMGANQTNDPNFTEDFVGLCVQKGDDWLSATTFTKDDISFKFIIPEQHQDGSLLVLGVRYNKFSFTNPITVLRDLEKRFNLKTLTKLHNKHYDRFNGFQVLVKLQGDIVPPSVIVPNLIYSTIFNTTKKCSRCNSKTHFSNECVTFCIQCDRWGHTVQSPDCPRNKVDANLRKLYQDAGVKVPNYIPGANLWKKTKTKSTNQQDHEKAKRAREPSSDSDNDDQLYNNTNNNSPYNTNKNEKSKKNSKSSNPKKNNNINNNSDVNNMNTDFQNEQDQQGEDGWTTANHTFSPISGTANKSHETSNKNTFTPLETEDLNVDTDNDEELVATNENEEDKQDGEADVEMKDAPAPSNKNGKTKNQQPRIGKDNGKASLNRGKVNINSMSNKLKQIQRGNQQKDNRQNLSGNMLEVHKLYSSSSTTSSTKSDGTSPTTSAIAHPPTSRPASRPPSINNKTINDNINEKNNNTTKDNNGINSQYQQDQGNQGQQQQHQQQESPTSLPTSPEIAKDDGDNNNKEDNNKEKDDQVDKEDKNNNHHQSNKVDGKSTEALEDGHINNNGLVPSTDDNNHQHNNDKPVTDTQPDENKVSEEPEDKIDEVLDAYRDDSILSFANNEGTQHPSSETDKQ